MDKIEVAVLHEAHNDPAGMMMFLARLTQKGHNVKNMDDLMMLYKSALMVHKSAPTVAKLPHGTIKRFTPITIAVVGASRRFLAQARTHQVGFNYVSASLQYSDYTDGCDFVVPYAITEKDLEIAKQLDEHQANGLNMEEYDRQPFRSLYLQTCHDSMKAYAELAEFIDNDTAGYAAPQGLRNILILQANHEAWQNFIRARACRRNTNETQYVTTKIWEALLATADGEDMFSMAGPDCVHGQCREGKGSCRHFIQDAPAMDYMCYNKCSLPTAILNVNWPLLKG